MDMDGRRSFTVPMAPRACLGQRRYYVSVGVGCYADGGGAWGDSATPCPVEPD
jgi:hypothetical protein